SLTRTRIGTRRSPTTIRTRTTFTTGTRTVEARYFNCAFLGSRVVLIDRRAVRRWQEHVHPTAFRIHCQGVRPRLRLDTLDFPPTCDVDDLKQPRIPDGDVEVREGVIEEDHVRRSAEFERAQNLPGLDVQADQSRGI